MVIKIEYCVIWNYTPEFDRVSKIIKKNNPEIKIIGNEKSPRSGSFEITFNGKIVFSKFEANEFPSETKILEILNA